MREQVVKVMVTLAKSQQRDDVIVASRVFVGIRLAAPHVRQRIDKERGVMADDQSQEASDQEGAPEIVGHQADGGRESQVGGQGNRQVVAMLEHDQGVTLQILDRIQV